MLRSKILGVAVGWAASIAIAVLATSWTSSAPSPSRPATPARVGRTEVAAPRGPAAAPAPGLSLADIRAAVRAELAAAQAEAAPSSGESDSAAEAAVPGDPAAFVRADDALTVAMADGRWTDDDRAGFRASLDGLDPDQTESLLSTITVAFNAGDVIVDTSGGPF
jgi:hypothetical protein